MAYTDDSKNETKEDHDEIEDKEVAETKNPVLRETRKLINDVEICIEKMDAEDEGLDDGERLEFEVLQRALEKFLDEYDKNDGADGEESSEEEGHPGLMIVMGHRES